jgi:ubiquinone/menaquinone biosynthesis C-methylase UbiE
MKVYPEAFIERICEAINGGDAIEIGCGNGLRSMRLAPSCCSLLAIDPDIKMIRQAQSSAVRPEITYQVGSATSIKCRDSLFDCAIFTLSLHHVPPTEMQSAIAEARRVTKETGNIIFLEPTFDGSLYEAEMRFDACDGDERAAKAYAYYSMLTAPRLIEQDEFLGETCFEFSSMEDFVETMKPKRNLAELQVFLKQHAFRLRAQRRINIFGLSV